MTHYYYDSKANKFYGPLDRMPPDKNDYFGFMGEDEVFDVESYDNDIESYLRYLSSAPSHPHTFTGNSRVVPEGEIRWLYEWLNESVIGSLKWEPSNWQHYNHTPPERRRRVATPKITEGPELPNLSASTANLSQIKDKDEWLKDVRGESTGYTSTSGEEADSDIDWMIHPKYDEVREQLKHEGYSTGSEDDTDKLMEELKRRLRAMPLTAQPDKPENGKTDDLLDCPFCGGRPEWIHLAHPSGIPALQCFECKFSMQQDRRDKTIFFWNRRTPPSPQTGEKGSITEEEISSLRWLLNKTREEPRAHVGKSMDRCHDKNGVTIRQHLESIWEKLSTRKQHQPPAAQSDQEAAEKHQNKNLQL